MRLSMIKASLAFLAITFCVAFPTYAVIPFTQVKGMYEGTKDEYKNISPFWGMVALHGKMLEWIRFFGPYHSVTKTIQIPGQEARTITQDEAFDKNDQIAELLLELFPSPDGVQFVANTRQGDLFGDLSRDLSKIDGIIQILISDKSNGQKVTLIAKHVQGLSPESTEKPSSAAIKFGKTLAYAYDKQKLFANPAKPEKQLYPENVVITALLAFYVKVADYKTQMKKDLPFLMKEEFDDKSQFTRDDYKKNKEIMKQDSSKPLSQLWGPELAFFMARGYDAYDNLFATPLTYRSDTCFLNSGNFPDCGESSLRNLISLLFSGGNSGIILTKAIDTLKKNIVKHNPGVDLSAPSPFHNMIAFFQKHPDISLASIIEAHNDWANVVSNLNESMDTSFLNSIIYGRSTQLGEMYEIKSKIHPEVRGIINMFNLIGKLIPDKVLNEGWSSDRDVRLKEVSIKLNRLCKLFSRKGFQLTWDIKPPVDSGVAEMSSSESEGEYSSTSLSEEAEESEEGPTIKLESEFVKIYFSVNNKPAFFWEFKEGHFHFDLLLNPADDWRLKYVSDESLGNEWMASLFRQNFTPDAQNYQRNFPLSQIYTKGLKDMEKSSKIVDYVFGVNLVSFHPLLGSWLEKTFPINDIYARTNIVKLLMKVLQTKNISFKDIKTETELEKSVEAYRSLLTKYNLKNGYQLLIDADLDNELMNNDRKDLLSHAFATKIFDVNMGDSAGNTLLHNTRSIDMASFLIDQGGDVNAKNTDGQTPIMTATTKMPNAEKLLSYEIHFGPEVKSFNQAQRLNPQVDGVSHDDAGNPKFMHHANQKDFDAFYDNQTKLISFLITKGGNIDLLDSNEFSPLHYIMLISDRSIYAHSAVDRTNELLQKHPELINKGHPILNWAMTSASRLDKFMTIIDLLLKYKADVNALDKDKRGPLFWAVWLAITQYDKRENIDEDDRGWIVTSPSPEECLNMIDLLVKQGAIINRDGKDASSPYYLIDFYEENSPEFTKKIKMILGEESSSAETPESSSSSAGMSESRQ